MTIIDLTHPLEAGMPVYPGTPPVRIAPLATIEAEGFRETRLSFTSHTGTHVDASAHMLAGGQCLDDIAPERFMGPARCLSLCDKALSVDRLERFFAAKPRCDFLLLYMGWDRLWGTDNYFHGYPIIEPAAAEWLSRSGLRGIGMDSPSPDPPESVDYPAHRILLENGILLIENLRGLERLPEKGFDLAIFPLLIAASDGAPARVIACLDGPPLR
ncbi:MAG TPA: cyclase family protein [Candidatus Aminicenantes bacterium]|nr:cyclase family protein [Candidatus Aminicenantes bacterium]